MARRAALMGMLCLMCGRSALAQTPFIPGTGMFVSNALNGVSALLRNLGLSSLDDTLKQLDADLEPLIGYTCLINKLDYTVDQLGQLKLDKTLEGVGLALGCVPGSQSFTGMVAASSAGPITLPTGVSNCRLVVQKTTPPPEFVKKQVATCKTCTPTCESKASSYDLVSQLLDTLGLGGPGGLLDGLLNTGNGGLLDQLLGPDSLVGGLLNSLLGGKGGNDLLGGLLGGGNGGGLLDGLLGGGDEGLLDGVLGEDGLLGGLLGGGEGGLLGGLLGGGASAGAGAHANTGGLLGGLLGGGNGGLLGGLLGGSGGGLLGRRLQQTVDTPLTNLIGKTLGGESGSGGLIDQLVGPTSLLGNLLHNLLAPGGLVGSDSNGKFTSTIDPSLTMGVATTIVCDAAPGQPPVKTPPTTHCQLTGQEFKYQHPKGGQVTFVMMQSDSSTMQKAKDAGVFKVATPEKCNVCKKKATY